MNIIEQDLLKKAIIKEYGRAVRREKKDEGNFIISYHAERKYYFIDDHLQKECMQGSVNRADAYLFNSYKKAREIADLIGGKVERV